MLACRNNYDIKIIKKIFNQNCLNNLFYNYKFMKNNNSKKIKPRQFCRGFYFVKQSCVMSSINSVRFSIETK